MAKKTPQKKALPGGMPEAELHYRIATQGPGKASIEEPKTTAERIQALKEKRQELKALQNEVNSLLTELLIEEYRESEGVWEGSLIGLTNPGRPMYPVVRVTGFIATLAGTVKPVGEILLKGGKVWTAKHTVYGTYKVLTEDEALKALRAGPEEAED